LKTRDGGKERAGLVGFVSGCAPPADLGATETVSGSSEVEKLVS
jgi:hypothetical protein